MITTQGNTVRHKHSNTGESGSEYQTNRFFINHTDINIVVTDVNNTPIVISRNMTGGIIKPEFVVRTTYIFKSNVSMHTTLHSIDEMTENGTEVTEVTALLRNALITALETDQYISTTVITISTEVDVVELKSANAVYLSNEDLVLQAGNFNTRYLHPRSTQGKNDDWYRDNLGDRAVTGVFIEIVDNNSNIEDRFTVIGDRVISIPTVKDLTRAEGCYFNQVTSNAGQLDINTEIVELTDLESVHIFRTQEEARSGGNQELLRSNAFKRLELDNQHMKAEYEATRIRFKEQEMLVKDNDARNKIKAEELKAQFEHEHAIRKNQELKAKNKLDKIKGKLEKAQLKRKDKFDQQSHKRRTSMEVLKMAPLILAGAFGAYKIFSDD